MRIILTHEQADFDALASILGAFLIEEGYLAVLPRRINRNVRAFLTIYGVELPFIDPQDLPSESIDKVTLVDTQSMVSVRGMNNKTSVQVIDHHPLRDDLPLEWMITVSGTGANTTLFVEHLQERDVALTMVQATLLLLGIYEDTGSLTYYRTTPRDLRAASYLLEMGASLEIASEFLNHPLSSAQQELYDQLRAKANTIDIHGQTVIVASADAGSMDEEFSSVAHKLRDLLDPDALFVLIATRGGIQLVARSTSSNIDVAEIASRFGGGGHDRAAAGLIKDRLLEDVQDELVQVLQETIHPAITVLQIMSPRPHLFAPDTSVEEAARAMQRYGYEGYPVVSDGKVVGLLTRRAVDRALAHRLHKTAASLMDAGQHTVKPDDSIDSLQHIMTETGWGQIPVIHPDTGEILGIVTRTDLIKSLVHQPRIPGRQNLGKRLEAALPPARFALLKAVSQMAFEHRAALYIVGGFVRDLLLERPSLDFDLVVEGDAIQLARALARQYGGRVTSHDRFGTAKWHLRDLTSNSGTPPDKIQQLIGQESAFDLPATLDFVTARREFYTHPTALPTVERGSIKLDLHRRDFTINTLALRLDGHHYGELHDYWGGLIDLRHGIVRVLHSLSFVDDPTRILRAVRFEQRFGFNIDKRTLELLFEAIPLLTKVSSDRIRHELNHILTEVQAASMLARLDELGLLKAIHPDLIWDEWLRSRIESISSISPEPEWELSHIDGASIRRDLSYIVWLIRLPVGQIKNVISRLKFSAELGSTTLSARQLWVDLPSLEGLPPSECVDRLVDYPMLAIYAVYLSTRSESQREILSMYVKKWKNIRITINGHELRALGLPPGPKYRHVLDTIRKAWLDGEINSAEEERSLLQTLLENYDVNSK